MTDPAPAATATAVIADLTDALARGRLAAAEIAAISPMELEALFELGAMRLDTRRNDDAVEIFTGLTSLFPYSAKYWRAYAIALHRLLELERARAAYDAALLLEPDHPDTLCYRGEILVYLGEMAAARTDLEAVKKLPRQDLTRRADALLACIDALEGWRPQKDTVKRTVTTQVKPEETGFTLGDGRSLPLRDGRYAEEMTDIFEPLPKEITQTCSTFVPEVADLWEPKLMTEEATQEITASVATPGTSGDSFSNTAPAAPAPTRMGDSTQSVTQTQTHPIIRHSTQPLRQLTAALIGSGVWEQAPRREATDTAVIPARLAFPPSLEASPLLTAAAAVLERETAVVPGRPLARALEQIAAARKAKKRREAGGQEATQTAIIRRRLHLPLCEED